MSHFIVSYLIQKRYQYVCAANDTTCPKVGETYIRFTCGSKQLCDSFGTVDSPYMNGFCCNWPNCNEQNLGMGYWVDYEKAWNIFSISHPFSEMRCIFAKWSIVTNHSCMPWLSDVFEIHVRMLDNKRQSVVVVRCNDCWNDALSMCGQRFLQSIRKFIVTL